MKKEEIYNQNPEIALPAEYKFGSPETFLSFRAENAAKINDFCEEYYKLAPQKGEENIRHLKIANFFAATPAQVKIIDFVLQSFTKPKSPEKARRKDGRLIATHSLQLFLTARDFFQIKNENILATLLLHDIAEDTQITIAEIAENLGKEKANFVRVMTEQRSEEETNYDRLREIVNFAEQIRSGGMEYAVAEIIDRLDDIADLTYLLSELEKNPEDIPLREQIKTKLLNKFGKCAYTVKRVAEIAGEEGEKLARYFKAVLERQLAILKERYGIYITDFEIEKKIGEYQNLI